ncbi:MAG: hypothetical protein WCD86_00505 [Ktedonobacteraceae bacterium]
MDHQLTHLSDGRFTCALCQWTWRTHPHSPCVGVPRFDYGSWPSTLSTATQLRRMKLKPGEPPDGSYPLVKAPYRRILYDISKATPRRVPTERQREAETSMRAALVTTDTRGGCGTYDGSHGQSRFGVTDGYCAACWREILHRQRQAAICAWAKTYLDCSEFLRPPALCRDGPTLRMLFTNNKVVDSGASFSM